tara:strand:- start:29544 stop:31547 length:2004 start_codon:yes stop_codon:yes gene_type:complete
LTTTIGIKENTAAILKVCITTMLMRARVYDEQWLRDVPSFSSGGKSTPAYSQNEYSTLLRRLQLLFFSISSQLVAAKEKDIELDRLTAVFDEIDNGRIQSIELSNAKPEIGETNSLSPFNVAMVSGYYLFCHYTNLNSTPVLNVCHPIVESEYRKEHRTTRYVTIKTWKGRAKKVVQGTFSEAEHDDVDNVEQEDELPLEIDKRDGLTFIRTLTRLSSLFNPEFNSGHPPLFYALTFGGKLVPFTSSHFSMFQALLSCYTDNRSVHAPYLIERFFEVLDQKTITIVGVNKDARTVKKEAKSLITNNQKKWAILAAYAALRALTDIPLKNAYMPLSYSEVNERGYVTVSFTYQDGRPGRFAIESRYVGFVKRLEKYAEAYNPSKQSKFHPNKKPTPYLLPLGSKSGTHQWDGLELKIASYLKSIGIFSGNYLLDINSQRIRATGANNNIDPADGGLSVATSLLQNSLDTLQDHYLAGDITQNQVIASQAIEALYEFAQRGTIDDATDRVRENRGIEVLEYEAWKALRLPTNPNGLLCGGVPTGEAQKEHRASQKRAQDLVDEDIELACYQYDKCVTCKSAKLVNDISNAYKLLSFIELLEDSIALMPEREQELAQRADDLMSLAELNLSEEVLEKAEDKLANEGRYPLHNQDFLQTMTGEYYHAEVQG